MMPHATGTSHPTSDILTQITTSLLASHTLPLSPIWLQANLPSSSLNQPSSTAASSSPPLPSLIKTVLFRLLSSDFTVSLSPPPGSTTPYTFPPNVTSPQTQSLTLPSSSKIPVQVLDIADIGSSLSAQLEALESAARGEGRRGREIVRTVDVEGGGNATSTPSRDGAGGGSVGPFKVLMSDMKGMKVWGFTTTGIEGINMPAPLVPEGDGGGGGGGGGGGVGGGGTGQTMAIGSKLLLQADVKVWRGMVMLTDGGCKVLGGKVEAWDRAWREGRMERLKGEIGRIRDENART